MARVLVVDTDEHNRLSIMEIIKKGGHGVAGVSSKEEALKEIDKSQPNLIITEIYGSADGLGILEFLVRERKDIPVIILSSLTQDENVNDSFRAGARAYLAKPFDFNELLTTLQEILGGSSNN